MVIVICIKSVYTKGIISVRRRQGMKIARFVLKIVGWSLAVAAAACCIVAYWDKIAEFFGCAKEKLAEKKACCCHHSDYDEYADWDD